MNSRISLLAVLATVLAFSSCMTRPLATEPTTISADIADVHLEFTYLDRGTLIDRHGSNVEWNRNPFVDYPGIMPRKNIIVLDTVITTRESTVELSLDEIKLKIDEKSGKAVSIAYLRNLWRPYQDDRGWSRIEASTRDNIFAKEFAADPSNPAEGYLVFPYNFPVEGGRSMLSLTLSTPDGDRGVLDIPLRFSENGMEPMTGNDDTGIFAEN